LKAKPAAHVLVILGLSMVGRGEMVGRKRGGEGGREGEGTTGRERVSEGGRE
jgi:hypothetical protein